MAELFSLAGLESKHLWTAFTVFICIEVSKIYDWWENQWVQGFLDFYWSGSLGQVDCTLLSMCMKKLYLYIKMEMNCILNERRDEGRGVLVCFTRFAYISYKMFSSGKNSDSGTGSTSGRYCGWNIAYNRSKYSSGIWMVDKASLDFQEEGKRLVDMLKYSWVLDTVIQSHEMSWSKYSHARTVM